MPYVKFLRVLERGWPHMANDDNQLGKNIKHLREMYGETLHELGEVIHFERSTVKGYENGSRKPDPHTLNK